MSLDLNLSVFPLEVVDNLVPQKCLVPAEQLPYNCRPGAWVRCMLSDGSFTICQIFTRGHTNVEPNCCFMDSTVGSFKPETAQSKGAQKQLLRLEALWPALVSTVELSFVVTENLFDNRIRKINLEYLKKLFLMLLPSYTFTSPCTVQNDGLLELGIAAIHMKATLEMEPPAGSDGKFYYTVTEVTQVNISNVQLLSPLRAVEAYPLALKSFERDMQHVVQAAQARRDMEGAPPYATNVLLTGAPGCGKTSLVASYVAEKECNCFYITAGNVLRQYPGEAEAEIRRVFNMARRFEDNLRPQNPTIVFIEDLHLLCPSINPDTNSSDASSTARVTTQLVNLLDDIYEAAFGIICLGTTSQPELLDEQICKYPRFQHEIAIKQLTIAERKFMFKSLYEKTFMARDLKIPLKRNALDFIAQYTQGYVISDFATLVRRIGQALLREPKKDIASILTDSLKETRAMAVFESELNFVKTTNGFETIGGMNQLKRTLRLSVLDGLQHRESFQKFGLNLPKGVLFYGPPGCAKTTLAKALAKEANMSYLEATSAEIYSPYVGAAEKFVEKMFTAARKNSPCLIFLDEIDAIVGRRDSSSGDVQLRVLSTLLMEMDGIIGTGTSDTEKHILVVGATNRPDKIDSALMRPGRFDKLIYVPNPDIESRYAILQLYGQRIPFAPNVDLEDIAKRTEQYSGADICNLCTEAAMHALKCDDNATVIRKTDFEYALAEQKASLTQAQIQWYENFQKSD